MTRLITNPISHSFSCKIFILTLALIEFTLFDLRAQDRYELKDGWKCINISDVKEGGEQISVLDYPINNWMPAVVPGTVLTTLLENEKIPDPFFGMNNEKIPDIYDTGNDYYTYWFVADFNESFPDKDDQVWIHLRGVNYSSNVFLNGNKLNDTVHKGMFLRQTYNITKLLNKDGANRLAVLIYPPEHPGNPNGGQGGDGTIGKNVSHQYVAGWDWIQPVRDRNTGIWDKVFIEKTRAVNIANPHVITLVPGKRSPGEKQAPATIKVTTELENPTSKKINGVLTCSIGGIEVTSNVELLSNVRKLIRLPDITLKDPKLWWPSGYGEQYLYDMDIRFEIDGKTTSDEEKIKVGVREIQRQWNDQTRSMQIMVNGQKIFIKGGNWIISDAMLRFSPERYDAEVRFHRDMNLNLIRIWGGALAERPEFYEACDKYGLLVMQDFWMSGDCNGRWLDPMKKEDQLTRRKYPDDHDLFLHSAADMVKMIRNHPSLAMYCGGNEITPPEDILIPLKDEILPDLDGTRWFIEYSNSDSMSFNSIGGNGDGPYGIQPISRFWEEKTFPFNSEVGSVGVGDYESLERFIPQENLIPPQEPDKVDSIWKYHKYIGYNEFIDPYGEAKNARDFAEKAQLVNYDQYRGLIEGFSSHMWDWYTGVIIWKTQNPWTAMRGQMYDYYLDPNACLYGLRTGSEPLHVMCNPVDGMVMIVNNTFQPKRDLLLKVEAYDMEGNHSLITQVFAYMEPTSVKKTLSVKGVIDKMGGEKGVFINLQILNTEQEVLSENFYWFPDANGKYTGLMELESANLQIVASQIEENKYKVILTNPKGNPVSFFNRISLIDPESKERILPTFFSDNYVSIPPGQSKSIIVACKGKIMNGTLISVKGWNSEERLVEVE